MRGVLSFATPLIVYLHQGRLTGCYVVATEIIIINLKFIQLWNSK
jgi:hypothetical protein